MQYWKIYNLNGYDENEDYPLFYCLPYSDTHFTTLQDAKNKAKRFENHLMVERDLRTPNVEIHISTGWTWKYNGKNWIKSKT